MSAAARRVQALFSSPERLLWAVWVRWLVIGGFFCLAIGAHALGLFASLRPCVQAAVIGGVLNGINDWCVRRRRFVVPVTAIAIPFDHLLITYVVLHTGGVQSPFVMMYFVQVLATAMLVATPVAALSALFALLLWLAAVGLQAAGYLQVPPVMLGDRTSAPVAYQVTWTAFLLYCLALLVYLGGYIAERLRASERDLAEKNQHLAQALASLRTAHDELRLAYERLQRTEAHLIQSEKLRSLGELVAGVAHELNNPISFVAANVEHLRLYMHRLRQALDLYTGLQLAADDRERLAQGFRQLRIEQVLGDLPGLLDDCEEGARRTAGIVQGLQRFSRRDERGAWQRTDLHRGIDSTLGLLTHRLSDRITVHRDFAALPEVECLPGQLNQVFMNLLTNAADAIGPNPGNIWISTDASDSAAPPAQQQPVVRIVFRDDGPGIPAAIQAKIFDPFFTTKGVGCGTGLGLSVSYGIVEGHHGTLTVDSTPGAGATFTVTLPVRQPSRQA